MHKLRLTACRKRTLSLSIAALSTTMVGAPRVLAQASDAVEEVVVTGSRIRQTSGMVTPTPVTAVTRDELTVYEPGGTVAEQLDALPQFFGNRSAQRSTGPLNAGSGSSYLDMRDLGPRRTLVLFDGSRVVPADMEGAVNIDAFPTALIRSVDVVTGGASATYGADALGGVTNFVLDREFEGLDLRVGTGTTEFGDGDRWNVSLAGGRQIGDRMHFIGSLEARYLDQIVRNPEALDSDWWQRWGHVTNPEWYPGAPAGIPQRLTRPWVCSSEHSPTGVIWARQRSSSTSPLIPFAFNGHTFLADASATRPLELGDVYAAPNAPGSTKSMSGGTECDTANSAYEVFLASEVIARSGFAGLKYDFSDNLSGFFQVLVGRSESNSKDRRSQYTLRDSWHATIFRDNAYLPEEIGLAMDAAGIDSFQLHKAGAFLGDNNIGLGDGKESFSTYSWSVGFDALIADNWNLRASWQSGESQNDAGLYGQTRIDRMFLGMDAVRDPATGEIVCRVQLYNPTEAELAAAVAGRESVAGGPLLSPVGLDDTISGCVPYNVLGAGNLSQEAVAYTQSTREEKNTVRQDFAEVVVSGEVAEGWSGPISLAAGLTYREQSVVQKIGPHDIYRLGPALNAPELGIRGIAPGYEGGSETLHRFSSLRNGAGEYDVWEWFSELNLPLWSASGAQRLDGSVAYRSSYYPDERVESWKLGLDFRALEDLRFRVTQSRDVREPAFIELFNNRGGAGGSVSDPAFDQSTYQITVNAGGNPNLRPEVADTVTAGIIYEPGWASALQLSADWYEVEIKDSIGSLGAQRIVDECAAGTQSLCASIERDPGTGLITRVHNGYVNVDQAKVRGVDFEAIYRMEPDLFGSQSESLSFRFLGGYLIERSDTPLGGTAFDFAGQLGTPELSVNATVAYDVGSYSIRLQQRHISDTVINARWVEGVDVDHNRVSSGNYTNLSVGYNGALSNGSAWNIGLSITNLFDRNPPIVASYGSGGGAQTIPNGYDLFGRRYQLSFNMRL